MSKKGVVPDDQASLDKFVAELLAEEAQAKDKRYRESGIDAFLRPKRPMTANTSFLRSVVCNVEGYNAYTSGGSNSDMKVGEMREDPAKDCKEEYKKSLKKRSSSRESRRQTGHSGRDEKQEHKKNEKEKHKKRKTSSKCLTVPPLMNFTQKRGNVKVMIVDWAQEFLGDPFEALLRFSVLSRPGPGRRRKNDMRVVVITYKIKRS